MARQIIKGDLNIDKEWSISPYLFYTDEAYTRVVPRNTPEARWRFPQGTRIPPEAKKALDAFERNGREFLPFPESKEEGDDVSVPQIKSIERPAKHKMVTGLDNK